MDRRGYRLKTGSRGFRYEVEKDESGGRYGYDGMKGRRLLVEGRS